MSATFLLAALIVFSVSVAVYLINRRLGKIAASSQNNEVLVEWLKSNNTSLNRAYEVIAGVQRSIGEMSEIGRSMKDLQDFLKSPKLRGIIGEQILNQLLSQTLPKQAFFIQHVFKSGAVVDAAIKTDGGIIPIDAKFPMENFKRLVGAVNEEEKKTIEKDFIRDVKKHIDDISQKYILTDEGTLDYALMYIPSEAVYYEMVANIPTLADYAHEKRVLPVSPSTFYGFLRAILMSFEGRKIEQKAKEILLAIRSIQKDYSKVENNLSIMGKHVQNAYNQMGNVLSSFNSLGQKISSTNALGQGNEEVHEIEQQKIS